MYARLLLFRLEPGSLAATQELVNRFDPVIKARKGFKSVTYFADDKVGEYGVFVLWESAGRCGSRPGNHIPGVQEGGEWYCKRATEEPVIRSNRA